jgi:hypothetical protein
MPTNNVFQLLSISFSFCFFGTHSPSALGPSASVRLLLGLLGLLFFYITAPCSQDPVFSSLLLYTLLLLEHILQQLPNNDYFGCN